MNWRIRKKKAKVRNMLFFEQYYNGKGTEEEREKWLKRVQTEAVAGHFSINRNGAVYGIRERSGFNTGEVCRFRQRNHGAIF